MASRRSFYHSVSVDVDIDSSVLKENGYHHKEDCGNVAAETEDELREVEQQVENLHDWHLENHGGTSWVMCFEKPCDLLTYHFRRRS